MTKQKIPKTMNTQKPTVWIGKKGIKSSLIKEVSKQLVKRKTMKVKVLKTALANEKTEEISRRIAEETQSQIRELRGCAFVVHKSKKS